MEKSFQDSMIKKYNTTGNILYKEISDNIYNFDEYALENINNKYIQTIYKMFLVNVLKGFLQSYLKQYKNNPNEMEFEVRFGSFSNLGHFINKNNPSIASKLEQVLINMGAEKITTSTTDTIYSLPNKRNIRVSESGILEKTSIGKIDIPKHGLRLALNREVILQEIPRTANKKSPYIRKKNRTSFILGKFMRIDTTMVNDSYEIELEITSPNVDFKDIVDMIYLIKTQTQI